MQSSYIDNGDQRHININGDSICLRCSYYPHYIVKGRKSCDKWKLKKKK